MRRIPVSILRGGTSKGVFLNAADIPVKGQERDALILSMMGSPDATGMQLNGLGGGISSTSKVCIISESDSPAHDVSYLFGQVSIKENYIDWGGSCANLSAAVGLYALRNKLTRRQKKESFLPKASEQVYVWQENLKQDMIIDVANPSMVKDRVSIPGIPGTAPPIKVRWVNPKIPGVDSLLPTGNAIDSITLRENNRQVMATLVCGTNPTVFVRAEDLGLAGTELPAEVNYAELEPEIEHIRKTAALMMGLEMPNDGLRVCWVASPKTYQATDGTTIEKEEINILARITTPGRVHHALTGTGAGNLALAANILGTVPSSKCVASNGKLGELIGKSTLRIGQPAGVMMANATVGWKTNEETENSDQNLTLPFAKSADLVRSAKVLMEGWTDIGVFAHDPFR